MEEYLVCSDDIHHYKKRHDGKWLHVVCPQEDKTTMEYQDGHDYEYTYRKNDCLINVIMDHTPSPAERKLETSDKERFEGALRTAIFYLGLYEYLKPINPNF